MNTFERFESGFLRVYGQEESFAAVKWSAHASFDGVELKHLITAVDTDGKYSYHLVRIAPDKKIGVHTHKEQLETHEIIAGSGFCTIKGKKLRYEEGVISIIPAGDEHEVIAGDKGLYLFAKFMPALC